MTPPIFTVCAADTALATLLADGTGGIRLYPFGEAPQPEVEPYAVWQVIDGSPENYLSNLPDVDAYTLQVDVYAATVSAAREVAAAIRDAIESVAYVVRYNGEWREPETRSYRCSFSVDWLVDR